jgi:AcrR family transcriptional regulator
MSPEAGGRETILDEAAKLFSQKGYKGVSIRDIAQACGMTNAALYYHFKNKEALYLAVLRHAHQSVMASVAEAGEPTVDIRVRLRQLVLRYAEVMCKQRQSFQTMRRDLAHIDDARAGKLYGEMRAGFLRPIQAVIEGGQASSCIAAGDSHLLARLLHGMIMAVSFEGGSVRQARAAPAPEEVERLVDVFLDGVASE